MVCHFAENVNCDREKFYYYIELSYMNECFLYPIECAPARTQTNKSIEENTKYLSNEFRWKYNFEQNMEMIPPKSQTPKPPNESCVCPMPYQ